MIHSQTIHTPTPSGTTSTRPSPSIVYNFSGALSVSSSPPVTPRVDTFLIGISATLGTAGSSSTQVNLLHNGTVICSVVIAASATYGYAKLTSPQLARARTDTYAVQISSAGTGASDLGGEIELGA